MICIKYDHAFAKDMEGKFIDYKASFASASTISEPSSSANKSAGSSTSTPASAAAISKQSNASVLLQNKSLRRNRNPFEEEGDENEDDSEFELDTSLPKTPSDRKLRSRVITIES